MPFPTRFVDTRRLMRCHLGPVLLSLTPGTNWLPLAFFNLINPVLSFIYAGLGFQIKHVKPDTGFKKTPEEAAYYGIGGQDAEELPFDGTEVSTVAPRRNTKADED